MSQFLRGALIPLLAILTGVLMGSFLNWRDRRHGYDVVKALRPIFGPNLSDRAKAAFKRLRRH